MRGGAAGARGNGAAGPGLLALVLLLAPRRKGGRGGGDLGGAVKMRVTLV